MDRPNSCSPKSFMRFLYRYMGNKIDHANTYRPSTDGYDFVDIDCGTLFCTQIWLMYFVCDQAGVNKR